MNKLEKLLGSLAIVFGAGSAVACHDKDEAPQVEVCPDSETTPVNPGEYFTVGRSPNANSVRFVSASQVAPDTYSLILQGAQGTVNAVVNGSNGFKTDFASFGDVFKVAFSPSENTLTVDKNGDALIENKNTLEKLVSHCENVKVLPGQGFVLDYGFGKEAGIFAEYDSTKAVFNIPGVVTAEAALYLRPDGALGGELVRQGVTYEFALNKDGSISIDRTGNGLEGFVSQGLPDKANGKAVTLPQGGVDTSVVGSEGYDSKVIYVSENDEIAKLQINGEVTPDLKAGDSYVLADGGLLKIVEVVSANACNSESRVNFHIQK